MTDTRLKGRIAVITGASSGLGRATAIRFADSGARIVCADIQDSDVIKEITSKHGEDSATFIKCDVSNEQEIEKLMQEAAKWGGRIDILATYAGIAVETKYDLSKRCHEMPTEDFDRTMTVNCRGVWLSCKYALKQMLEQEPREPNARGERTRGRIVNAASMLGLVGLAGGPCYVPAKHAVVGMTKQMAIDYAEDRIHVNCLCPGFVKSPMIKSFLKDDESEAGLASTHPWNSLGRPEDVADAALFLASDDAAWVSGHAMVIDGAYICR
ncbi:Hypothetical protein R9X50_00550200 [Acrodontium crateriforme]|uniref:Uncharacterized protein n=1 Tax=Acrodontium crateriforme TaxID=150365 RepID=A0AAQ3M691_9PEZI|nr:Hypothetical protein R9X50_00550200 [Acrodontium crateriforme]